MHTDRNRKFNIGRFIPDIETIIISALVVCFAVYGRYQQGPKPTAWFALLMLGWGLFLMPKAYLLIEKGSKGWGLHDADAGFIIFYSVGYVLMGLGTIGIIVSLFTKA
jgi:hypothetical protein